jgi:hypothetical protein
MPLTAAEREFLSQTYRFEEAKDEAVRTRHAGARELEISSGFVTLAGATVALTHLQERLLGDRRQIVATVSGALSLSFHSRPPTVRLHHRRFGGNLETGELYLCEQLAVDHEREVTTLYLTGGNS